jgi:acyl-CoA synthetase (AMP-forming)/AMP-acid ligase II
LSRAKELNTDGSTVLVDASAAESDDRETVLFSDIVLDEGRAPHLRPERRGSDAAVVTFSAGSSGSPKGIVYSHDGLLAEAWQLNAALPWNYPKALSVAPISHAIGFLTTFVIPLIRCLDILVDQSWDPRRALAWCQREQYSPFCGLPSMVSAVLDSPDFNPEMIRSLPCVGLGGSAVPGELLHRLEALGAKPYQMYGSTELPSVTSTLSGGNLGTTEGSPNLPRVVVGLPLPANQVEIRDEAGKICGPHIEGHVVCRGPELCVGYVDSADVAVDEEGWLWTGDLGYIDHHGRLVISGRISSQIQVAGEKVSAEAIEDLLALRIGEAAGRRWAVSASLAPLLGEVVTLAAVPGIRGELRLSELVRELRERGVPALHCPARIVEVDAIPATDVGKIDRQRLGSKVRAALGQIG